MITDFDCLLSVNAVLSGADCVNAVLSMADGLPINPGMGDMLAHLFPVRPPFNEQPAVVTIKVTKVSC
jgi:hypothetical protein